MQASPVRLSHATSAITVDGYRGVNDRKLAVELTGRIFYQSSVFAHCELMLNTNADFCNHVRCSMVFYLAAR